MSRAFSRRDNNHAEIVARFRELGCEVMDCAGLKDGAPDLVVSCGRKNHLVEVKAPKGRLKPGQIDFARRWKAPIYICRSVDAVMALVECWRVGQDRDVEVIQ